MPYENLQTIEKVAIVFRTARKARGLNQQELSKRWESPREQYLKLKVPS